MAGFNISALLKLDGSQFNAGIGKAESAVSKLAGRMAALFSLGAITAFTRSTINWASNISDVATQTGLAVDQVQRLGYAANKAGVDFNLLATAVNKLGFKKGQALINPNSAAARGFAAFGFEGAKLEAASVAEILKTIGSVGTDRLKDAKLELNDLFEETAPKLIEAFAEFASESLQNATVASNETIQSLDKAKDAMGELGIELKATLAPAIALVIGELVRLKREANNYWGDRFAALGAVYYSVRKGDPRSPKEIFQDAMATSGGMRAGEGSTAAGGSGGTFTPTSIVPPSLTNPVGRGGRPGLYTDSLLGVGNFLGAAGGQANSVEQKQLVAMNSINDAVKSILSVMQKGGINFPS